MMPAPKKIGLVITTRHISHTEQMAGAMEDERIMLVEREDGLVSPEHALLLDARANAAPKRAHRRAFVGLAVAMSIA